MKLTDRDIKLYKEIKKYNRQHGYSPTYRELQQLCNISSLSVVKYRLDKLKALGYIDYKRKSARTIEII